MLKNSRFSKFINKINPVIIFVLLLFTSLMFDGAAVFGVTNSSLVVKERYVNKVKKDYGRVPNYIRRAQSANQRNLDEKLRVQNENERYKNRMRKTLDNEELTLLREGLKNLISHQM